MENRVLVGIPERLRKANEALRQYERKIEILQGLYNRRGQVTDTELLDLIGEYLAGSNDD